MNSGHGPYIAGVGAALVDLLVEESDPFVTAMGSDKGGMTLVELLTIDSALKKTQAPVKVVPGGSACNTMVGIGNLGGKARMIGRLGRDELGKAFLEGIGQGQGRPPHPPFGHAHRPRAFRGDPGFPAHHVHLSGRFLPCWIPRT